MRWWSLEKRKMGLLALVLAPERKMLSLALALVLILGEEGRRSHAQDLREARHYAYVVPSQSMVRLGR